MYSVVLVSGIKQSDSVTHTCLFCFTFFSPLCLVTPVVSDSLQPHGLSAGKNTGEGCHFLLHFSLIGYYKILSIVPCAV